MFLILSGRSDVTLPQIQNVPISSTGVSIMTLRDVAKQFHVDTEIRRYRPEEVDLMPIPAIGLFKTSSDTILQFHFDVVYKVDASRVYLLNGTTGEQYWIRRSKLPAFWAGVAMMEKRSLAALMMDGWRPALLAACLAGVDIVILARLIGKSKYRETGKVITETEVIA
jgi:hypothetical protein